LLPGNYKKTSSATMDRRTILWADDDADDLDLFLSVLRELTSDYNIKECRNGKEVLDYLEGLSADGYPCLIILDMNMPVLSGRDTLAALKHNTLHKDIPVVVFTTSSSDLDKRFCDHHHTEMITKPPTYDKLKDIVGRMLQYCGS
jgi:CheY-like chemotaxis protein